MDKKQTIEQRAKEYSMQVHSFRPELCAADYIAGAKEEHILLTEWNNAARTFPNHERKVLLMNRRAGVEYSTGWYDRECEQWHVDDRTMIAVDYWREIHE